VGALSQKKRSRGHRTARAALLFALVFVVGWASGWFTAWAYGDRVGYPWRPGLSGSRAGADPGPARGAVPGPASGPAPPDLVSGPETTGRAARLPEVIDLSSMFPGEVFVSGPRDAKLVALTFDDGPDNQFTPRVLDMLKQEGVPATFFMIGNRVRTFPDVVTRTVQEGHVIGNHTWDHSRLAGMAGKDIRRNIEAAQTAIAEVAGYRPLLFRPAYGDLTPADVPEITSAGVKIVFWSVDTLDWRGLNSQQVVAAVMGHAHPGAIVLQHSAGGRGEDLSGSVAALPVIIRDLRAHGYRFVTVPDLLRVPVAAAP